MGCSIERGRRERETERGLRGREGGEEGRERGKHVNAIQNVKLHYYVTIIRVESTDNALDSSLCGTVQNKERCT